MALGTRARRARPKGPRFPLAPPRRHSALIAFAIRRPIVTAVALYAAWLVGWTLFSWGIVSDQFADSLLTH